jgi:hypothetical protein
MAIFKSDAAKGLVAVPNPQIAGADYTVRYSMQVPTTGLTANDILEMACIPPGCRVTNMVIDTDDLDSGTAMVFDVGIMSGKWQDEGTRTCGNEFASASTLAQAGGVLNPTRKEAYRTAPAAVARSIGIKITTLAGTAIAGTIGITVSVAA